MVQRRQSGRVARWSVLYRRITLFRAGIVGCLSAAVVVLSIFSACTERHDETRVEILEEPLLLYVGGTMRPVMEEIVLRYVTDTGRQIELDYAGSGELFIRMTQTQRGDLYVSHDPYAAAARKKGIADHVRTLALMEPVIVVQKGNPLEIEGLEDLVVPGVQLLLTDRMYSTTGHIVAKMYEKLGLSEALDRVVLSRTRCPCEAANSMTLETADAAIVWNAVARLRTDDLDIVPIDPSHKPQAVVDAVTSATFGTVDLSRIKVTIVSLKYSTNPEAAARFSEFAASEACFDLWKDYGFDAPNGEW